MNAACRNRSSDVHSLNSARITILGSANRTPAIRGTPNLGGPIVTASGLVFIAAAMDNWLRAFDSETGKELWSSGDQIASWNHFSGLTVANGRVYIGTFDGLLYAFGVDRPAETR